MTERDSIPTTSSASGEAVAAAWPDLFANLQAAYAKVIDTQFEMERRAAELQDSRDLLRQVIASMSEALFLLDRTGRVMQVNPAALALIDRSEDECLGQLFRKICPDPNAPISAWKILSKSVQGSLTGLETELRGENGQLYPVNLSAAVVRNRNGRIDGVLIIAQERRPQHQRQNERAQSLQRTATMQLAGRLATELAKPVNVIRGYSQHLQAISHLGDTIDEQWLTDLQRVAAAANELTRFVMHLQAIGHPALGTFKPVDLNQVARAALLLTAVTVENEPVPIQRDLAPSLPAVQGDWHELTFALSELVQQMVSVLGRQITAVIVTTSIEADQVCVKITGRLTVALAQQPSIVPASVQHVVARHNGEVQVEMKERRIAVVVTLLGLGNEQ